MARKYFIAGNWKMNNTAAKAVELIEGIKAKIGNETSVDIAVCPTFTALDAASKALKGSTVKLGAQNMYFEAKAVIANGMKPILCVGEKLEDREANKTIDVVSTQTIGGLEGLSKEEAEKVVVAYEPVWAIGTGKTATPEMAQEVHAEIRKILAKLFGEEVSEKIQILYGGSMKPENADALLAEKDIDGGLIGGAALKADSFAALIESAKKAK